MIDLKVIVQHIQTEWTNNFNRMNWILTKYVGLGKKWHFPERYSNGFIAFWKRAPHMYIWVLFFIVTCVIPCFTQNVANPKPWYEPNREFCEPFPSFSGCHDVEEVFLSPLMLSFYWKQPTSHVCCPTEPSLKPQTRLVP